MTSIGDGAFENCTNLTSITIPASVTSIGNSAFDGCTNLTNITIGASVTSIGKWAFYQCTNLSSITIPASVTSIGNGAFYGCTNLTDITIPASVTSIDYSAFNCCTSLTDVYYTGSAAQWASITIGSNNESLTEATIHYNWIVGGTLILPTGLTMIGPEAFVDLPGVNIVYIRASVTDIADDSFDPDITIRAPVGSYAITRAINHGFAYIED